ncbi:MAG: aa3-type cytochrome oxidase subunit II [Nocardioidaceae bacterium]
MYAVLTASTLLLGACSSQDKAQIRRLAQPQDVTDRSGVMHSLWMWAWLAAILTGILVWGLIGYACIKFRRRHDDEVPVQTRYNLPIEILYTIAPVVMVVVFFFFTVQAQDKVLAQTAHPDHTVDVVGQQWSWTFNYVQDKALDGQTSVYDAGTTAYRPTLVLPVNETVRFNLSSPDVIHSFWVPAFLMKMDVVPGRDNHFDLTPTREGTYVGRCAELCGTYHSRMLFNVKVVSADQFATYLKQLQAKGQTGLALGGSDATTEKGLTNAQNGAGQ